MKKRVSDAYFLFFAVCFLLIVVCFKTTETRVFDLSEESVRQKIEPVKIVQVDADIRDFYFEMEKITDRNSAFGFFSSHDNVRVYEDGKMVYALVAEEDIWGTTPGARWNFVEIVPGTREIRVRLKAAYPVVRDREVDFYQGSGLQMCLDLMRASILEIIVSILDFSIGLILVGVWIAVNRKISIGRAQLYIGVFAVIMGLWSLHETELMMILIRDRAAASFGGYMLVMLMTVPFVLFIREILEVKEEKFSELICAANFVGIIVCTVLHMSGIAGFKETALMVHLVDLGALVYTVYALVCWIRTKGFDRVAKVNVLGAAVLGVSFAVDILAFYNGARKTDVFGRFGFLLYISILGWQVSSNALYKINEGRKAKIYKELAVKDVLTKVFNRNAYNEWVSVNPKPVGSAIVTFDLNNLKKCNDTLGHGAGDEYIMKSAELISQTFGKENACFRIGGDEFCVIVKKAEAAWIEQRLLELEERERKYNAGSKQIKIQIAHGYAVFDEKLDDNIEKTRDRADTKMYENKKERKAGQ